MIGVILNNDKRMEILCEILKGKEIYKLIDSVECDTLILPVQGIDKFGYCYNTNINIYDLVKSNISLKNIFTGKANNDLIELCNNCSINLIEYTNDFEFIYKNSLLTVEGFLKTLLNDLTDSLSNYKILVLGYGNLGKMLCKVFNGLNLSYSVIAPTKNKELLINKENIANNISEFDIIVNTIPANIIAKEEYYKLKDKLIYELASEPYGFDLSLVRVKLLPGIPGKIFPKDAALNIHGAIKKAFL